MSEQWVEVGELDEVEQDDVIRFDYGTRTFAIYRTLDNCVFATDGQCTHANVHLADGFVEGTTIECPKHNGRFDFTTGKAKSIPAIVDLGCYPVRVVDGTIMLDVG